MQSSDCDPEDDEKIVYDFEDEVVELDEGCLCLMFRGWKHSFHKLLVVSL